MYVQDYERNVNRDEPQTPPGQRDKKIGKIVQPELLDRLIRPEFPIRVVVQQGVRA